MSKNIYMILAVATALLTSCASSYNVSGTSSVSAMDGSKLYLKAVKNNDLQSIDSCEVVHGEFHFAGLLDTVRMVSLFMDDESILPLVLEEGEIVIRIENAVQSVSGTPLNDSLYVFVDKHNQLSNRMNELSHRQSQMLLDGVDEEEINRQLSAEADEIAVEEDRLVTKFICDNFDNVLGPGIFMMVTSQYRFPVLTPQIEEIMAKATDHFKSDPYVRDYYQAAQENEARMNGTKDIDGDMSAPLPDSAAVQPAAPLTNVPQP